MLILGCSCMQLFFIVSDNDMTLCFMDDGRDPKQHGYVNRQGLSRKVTVIPYTRSIILQITGLIHRSQHIFDSVKASLKRLQLKYIDVLQCQFQVSSLFSFCQSRLLHTNRSPFWLRHPHRRNCTSPINRVTRGYVLFWLEQMQALHDIVEAGYVRYIGMSSCFAWQCSFCF